MRLYYDNLINDTTLTASSSYLNYNVDNLKIAQLAKKHRFVSNNEWVVMAFTTATNIKSFIVDIGNLSQTATLTLEGNATDVWTSPSYSHALNMTTSCAYLDLDETYKYWRLTIVDTSVSTIDLGYIHLDSGYLQMPGIALNAEIYYNTTNERDITQSGQVLGNVGYEFMETTFNFPQISEDATIIQGVDVATRKEIITFWQTVGNNIPFWVFLWESCLDEYEPFLCVVNDNKITFKKLKYGKYYSTSINLREVL